MKLKFILFALSFVALLQQAHSQNVGINGTGAAPDVSAMLDIVSSNKGLLIPRISLSSTADAAISPATSLLVYNTNAAMTNGNGEGFYYNSGTSGAPSWVKLYASNGKAWETLGNASTSPSTNFLGTTDLNDLVFKTNNTEWMRVLSDGNVGIGMNAPTYKLHVTPVATTGKGIRVEDNGSNPGVELITVGDDAYLTDLDAANTLGVYGLQDATKATVKLGSGGGTVSGANGNVGINNNAPAQPLDVTGNVRFSGALMPNNLPGTTGQILTSAGANNPNAWLAQGTSGQVLTSAGTGAAPTWAALGQTVVAVTSAANTAIVSNNTGTYATGTGRGWTIGTWQDVSGLTVTRTTPAGKKVTVSFSIDGYGNDWSYYAPLTVVFRLLRDGVQIGKASVLSVEDGFYYYYWNANFISNTTDGDGNSHIYKVQYWMSNDYVAPTTERAFIEDRSLIVTEIAP